MFATKELTEGEGQETLAPWRVTEFLILLTGRGYSGLSRILMTTRETLKGLEANGTAQNCKIYARHGARPPMFGVSYANIEKLRKKIGVNQALAVELWESGNHDARVLAAKIADPERCTPTLLSRWAKESDNVLSGAVAQLAARCPGAQELGAKWIKSSNEWQAVAGWSLLSLAADGDGTTSDAFWKDCLSIIEKQIHTSPNWVRYAMNGALIGIGVGQTTLTKQAMAIARKIGQVEVDHGETGCKTPDAGPYILKTLEHRAKKREA